MRKKLHWREAKMIQHLLNSFYHVFELLQNDLHWAGRELRHELLLQIHTESRHTSSFLSMHQEIPRRTKDQIEQEWNMRRAGQREDLPTRKHTIEKRKQKEMWGHQQKSTEVKETEEWIKITKTRETQDWPESLGWAFSMINLEVGWTEWSVSTRTPR